MKTFGGQCRGVGPRHLAWKVGWVLDSSDQVSKWMHPLVSGASVSDLQKERARPGQQLLRFSLLWVCTAQRDAPLINTAPA